MTQSWPTFDEAHNWAEEEEAFEKVMDYIKQSAPCAPR